MTDGVCAKLIYYRDNKLIEDDVYVVPFYYAKNFFQIFKCKDSDKCKDSNKCKDSDKCLDIEIRTDCEYKEDDEVKWNKNYNKWNQLWKLEINSDKYYIKSFTNDFYLSYGDDKYYC